MRLLFVLHPHLHGFRWAIYLASEAQFRAEPLSRCVNAGFQHTLAAADAEGQQCLYTLLAFCGRMKLQVQTTPLTLDVDPLPVGASTGVVQVSPEVLQIGVE